MLAAVLTGGAFCMFAVIALWLAGAGEQVENGSIRRSSLHPASGDELGSSGPVELPREPDVAPRVASAFEITEAPLDRELAAGNDDAEELDRDLLVPPPAAGKSATVAPTSPRAVPDAGTLAPETVARETGGEGAEETHQAAGAADPEEPPLTWEACGMNVCAPGLVCCNASCGTCVSPGETCSQLACSMAVYPVAAFCGRNTCSVGEVCCNLSCGICAAPGEPCSQRLCD